MNKPTSRWKKCKPVRKKNTEEKTESFREVEKTRNSLICKEMKQTDSKKEIEANRIGKTPREHSIAVKDPPRDTAAFDSNRVLAKVSSHGSGRKKPSK